MSARDLPDLTLLCLKVIAKTPTDFVNEKALARPYRAYPKKLLNSCTQMMIDYISEAGRLTDAVFPLNSFETDRTYLSLKNSKISSNYLLAVLKRCPLLTHLDVSGCFPVDDDVISDILDFCPLLQELCIRNCRKLTDAALGIILKKSRFINNLSIGGNINITEIGLQHFINSYPLASSLLELHVSGLPLAPDVLSAVAKRCLSLRNLSLGYAIVTPDTFGVFMEHVGGGLEVLSLAWAEAVVPRDVGDRDQESSSSLLDHVRKHCAQLVSLDLTGMKHVNAAALSQLIDYKHNQMEKFPGEWKGLEHIKIKFLPVTKQQLEQLRGANPGIVFEQ